MVAASVYSKKDKQLSLELCDKEKNCEDKTKLLLQNFVEIHQNMLDDLKKKYLTDENIKKFNEKKADLMVYLEDYKKEAEQMLNGLLNWCGEAEGMNTINCENKEETAAQREKIKSFLVDSD